MMHLFQRLPSRELFVIKNQKSQMFALNDTDLLHSTFLFEDELYRVFFSEYLNTFFVAQTHNLIGYCHCLALAADCTWKPAFWLLGALGRLNPEHKPTKI